MDVMVFIGLGAAAGVIVLLFIVTRVYRAVWGDDDLVPSPRFERRSREKSAEPSSLAEPRAGARSNGKAEPSASTRASSSLVERVEAHVSSDLREARSDVPDHADGGGGFPAYRQVGEQVTAVLTTAERAAADICEAASREAEDLRLAAEEELAEAKAEAERIRTQAETYRDETKNAADSYADQTRRAGDADAAKARAEAEESARAAEADGRRKATEIETAALRRRDELRQSATDLEERIAGMLGTFRAMTVDLEGLLPRDGKGPGAKPNEAAEADVDDDLEDALKPERVA